jgi:glutaredoxin
MKKIIVLALLAFAGFKFYQNGFSFSSTKGAFDKHGKPMVVLFDGPGCGEHCEKVRLELKRRGVVFDEIKVAGADGAPVSNKYGINSYPTTLIGKHEVRGDDLMQITSALAENYGKEVLTRMENMAMDNHFDTEGRAKVVMYGTSWCPYCKQQREYFAANKIPYEEIDVEQSKSNELLYSALQGAGYPLIYVGYRRFPGYKEEEIVIALKELAKAGPVRR